MGAWREGWAPGREERAAERRRDEAIRRLIRAYVASGRDYDGPERLALERALRGHERPVECDGWLWRYSRGRGSIMRMRAAVMRKAATS